MTIFPSQLWSGARKKTFHLATLPLLNFWLLALPNLLLVSFASVLLSSTSGEANRFCSYIVWYFEGKFLQSYFQRWTYQARSWWRVDISADHIRWYCPPAIIQLQPAVCRHQDSYFWQFVRDFRGRFPSSQTFHQGSYQIFKPQISIPTNFNLFFSDLLLLNACPTKPIGQILQQLHHLPLAPPRLRWRLQTLSLRTDVPPHPSPRPPTSTRASRQCTYKYNFLTNKGSCALVPLYYCKKLWWPNPTLIRFKHKKQKCTKFSPKTQPFAFQFDNGSKGGESFETFRDFGTSPKLSTNVIEAFTRLMTSQQSLIDLALMVFQHKVHSVLERLSDTHTQNFDRKSTQRKKRNLLVD